MDMIAPSKGSFESIIYLIVFGIILVVLGYYVLKHLKAGFVIGLRYLDDYIINDKGLDTETFAVSLPNTPKLYVMNSSFGSAISFKSSDDKTVRAYLCTIKNTSNSDAPIQIKVIRDIEGLRNEKGYIVVDLVELNDTDTYSVVIHPITNGGKGVPSNIVYAYKKDDDPDATYLETTPIDTNLDNYNFSVDITKQVYKN